MSFSFCTEKLLGQRPQGENKSLAKERTFRNTSFKGNVMGIASMISEQSTLLHFLISSYFSPASP